MTHSYRSIQTMHSLSTCQMEIPHYLNLNSDLSGMVNIRPTYIGALQYLQCNYCIETQLGGGGGGKGRGGGGD